jgi:transketolase
MSTSSERCRAYRRRILEISQRVTCHVAPAFSCLEIVDTIYHGLKRPQDVFVMSKGHGALAQYVVLEQLGVLPSVALDRFCTPEGRLGGHPDRGVAGIEASTGSLGHGLGMAVGMAYAEKLKGSDVRVYVVCSDGELQAGSTWEAVRMAAELKLDNLVLFVDANGWGGMDRISVGGIMGRLEAFCWSAYEVDGHESEWIRHSADQSLRDPLAIVCRTVKGKGVSFIEDRAIWHYRSPSKEEYAKALEELA